MRDGADGAEYACVGVEDVEPAVTRHDVVHQPFDVRFAAHVGVNELGAIADSIDGAAAQVLQNVGNQDPGPLADVSCCRCCTYAAGSASDDGDSAVESSFHGRGSLFEFFAIGALSRARSALKPRRGSATHVLNRDRGLETAATGVVVWEA